MSVRTIKEGIEPDVKARANARVRDTVQTLLERIEGDYYNVVGLPLHRLYRTLHASFDDLLEPPSP